MKTKILGIFCSICIFFAIACFAEVAIYKSPVVWRGDEKGDYFLPKVSEGRCESKEIISAEGNIESVLAVWEFTGEVRLEVSVDGGDNYTSVINGVPIYLDVGEGLVSSRIIKGKEIKWRANIGEDSVLTEVRISFTDSSGVKGSFGNEELSGFKYRKKIEISGSEGETLFNYQVKLIVGDEIASAGSTSLAITEEAIAVKTAADFSDIRWACADGQTLLPYYIEQIDSDGVNRVAFVWVKIPQIPELGVFIYLYYGCASADDQSDITRVFDFYDDFSQGLLDIEKWDSDLEFDGSISSSSLGLNLSEAAVISKLFNLKEGIVEYRGRGVTTELILYAHNFDSIEEDGTRHFYASNYSGAEHCISAGAAVQVNDAKPISAQETYDYRVIASQDQVTFERYSEGFREQQARAVYMNTDVPSKGALAFRKQGKSLSLYEWVRARKYAKVEPKATMVYSAEAVNLPVFNNTVIKENGNIGLAEQAQDGVYESAPLAVPFDISVLRIGYEPQGVEGISLAVSADAGKNYKTDCVGGECYYSARKDFTQGNKLVYKLYINNLKDNSARAQVSSLRMEYLPGGISLIQPNGGEKLTAGKEYEIKWSALDYDADYPIKLEYSLDNGDNYQLIEAAAPNTGSFIWAANTIVSDSVLVKVSAGQAEDVSDEVFSISKECQACKQTADSRQQTTDSEQQTTNYELQTPNSELRTTNLEPLTEKEKKVIKKKVAKYEKRRIQEGEEKYDLLVKVGDDFMPDDPEADDRESFKEGDVFLIRPAGGNWSRAEQDSFLIISLYLTKEEQESLVMPREDYTGEVNEQGEPVRVVVRKRGKNIDLDKFGVKGRRLSEIQEFFKDKALSGEIVVEK